MGYVRRLASLTLLLLVTASLALGGNTNVASAQGKSGDAIPGQYIVTLRPDAQSRGVAQRLANAHGLGVSHVYEHAIKGFAARIPDARLEALRSDPDVLSIEPDRVVTLEGVTVERRAPLTLFQSGQSLPTGINRIDGELNSTKAGDGTGSVNIDVAVIDTGIDIDHPDLNVVGGVNCSSGKSYDDGNGHGTHVGGTIGAKDNTTGVVGVAPGARLWAVRVLDNRGSGTTSAVICGIDWVTANASTIEVANMSLGGSGSDSACGGADTYHNAICRSVNAGVTYVVAAGNSTADSSNYRPATYAEVITVSALSDFNGVSGGGAASTCRADEDDTFANFSNYGADVDIIAPGVCINSTWLNGGYNSISGTSMASPHVAGAAALYKANNPSATPAQIKSALLSSGNLDWNNVDDKDRTKEVLLNVAGY